jgi:hypothetical protein
MHGSTDRLRLAPDDHSGMRLVGWGSQTKERPRSGPGAGNTGCGAGPTHNPYEGADMAKSTRGSSPSDRWTRTSGVNITPPVHLVPVTTTRSAA